LLTWAQGIVDTRNAIRTHLGTVPAELAQRLWLA